MRDHDGRSERTVLAAFDFDHTLTTRDSVVPFIVAVAGVGGVVKQLARSPRAVVIGLMRRDRDRLRELATRCFAGRPAAEVAEVAAGYIARPLRGRLRDDTVGRLRAHVAAGHRVVIVSASYEEYLDPLAAELGAETVLASRLAVADGRCTGELDGPNCRGAEKVRRLEAWLASEGQNRSDVDVWAYGDSKGDRELLAWADHATWVGRAPIPHELAT